ncbi:MAG TPA: acyltransferase domain-containing protein [Telluria sp.]
MFDLARSVPRAAALIDGSGYGAPDPARLFDNRVAQPSIVCATVAMWEAIRSAAPVPTLVAGYSIGELSAHAVAGAIDGSRAIELAALRAALMDKLAADPPQAMVALGGLPQPQLRQLAQRAGFHVAIVTGPDTCIAGGLARDVERLQQFASAAAARTERLPVAVASHTPLMQAAVAPFAAALEAETFTNPACPVLAGISASPVYGKADAVEQLSRQLAETIVWSDCMDSVAEAGISVALELGPGAALSRMVRTLRPEIACRSVAEFRSLQGITDWLDAQCS